jgi:signal transduction histidine kinase
MTTGGLALASVTLGVLNRHYHLPAQIGPTSYLVPWGEAIAALVWAACGWYLTIRRPGVIFGPVALVTGWAHGLAGTGLGWAVLAIYGHHPLPAPACAMWLWGWTQTIDSAALALIVTLFPDGRRHGGIAGWLGLTGVLICVVGVLHTALEPNPLKGTIGLAGLQNPLGTDIGGRVAAPVFFVVGGWTAKAALVIRWRKAVGEARAVLRIMTVVALATAVVGTVFIFTPGGPLLAQIGTVVFLAALAALVLRHRVYGIEAVLNRALVYALLSVVVAAVYGIVVGAVALSGGSVSGMGAFLAALLAALAVAPARQRVQRSVNRFLYGDRDDPYVVVSRLGAQVETAGSAQGLLEGLLEALADALRLPYTGLVLTESDGGPSRVFGQGEPTSASESFPLVHQGEDIGRLVVSLRSGQTSLDRQERDLLTGVARQMAVAAANVALTEQLLRSRERIVNAAEDERRRLRRDLHDGLGPILTAATSKIDAAGNLMGRDPDRVAALLGDVRSQLSEGLTDLRRLVYALRPPALDELGLLEALREMAARAPLPVSVDLPPALPTLPPAVEAAAYRIAAEAINNVARHANATHCSLQVRCDGAFALEVRDDGPTRGMWKPGVGLSSLCERTTDLGGSWLAGPDGNGGRVQALLPLGPQR